MGNGFTHYWQNDTWQREAERADSDAQLTHLAGNDFARRGVEPGDTVYVVTNIAGEMRVAGRMVVDRYVNAAEAERVMGYSLWGTAGELKRKVPVGRWPALAFEKSVETRDNAALA